MKISILSAIWSRYSLEHAFEAAARCGYDGIDLYGGRPHAYPYDMTPKRIDEVLALKERYHLEIPAYTPEVLAYPFNIASRDEAERADAAKLLDRALDVAHDLGVKKLQITSGHSGYDTTREENLEHLYSVLCPLVEKAGKKDVTVILEPVTIMESNVTALVDDMVEILAHVDSPYLKTMMDTVTPPVNRETYAEHFEKLGKKIAHMHFVDSNGIDQSHLLLGTGVIDMQGLRDTIRHYGYDGWLTIDVIARGIMQPDIVAAGELRYIRKLFDQA